jgi:hypothetical protein
MVHFRGIYLVVTEQCRICILPEKEKQAIISVGSTVFLGVRCLLSNSFIEIQSRNWELQPKTENCPRSYVVSLVISEKIFLYIIAIADHTPITK